MNFNTLLTRVATALIFLALIGLAFYFGFSWMIVLAFGCAALAQWEFYSLFWPGKAHFADKLAGMGMAFVLFAGAWLHRAAGFQGSLIAAVALCLLIAAVVFLVRYGTGDGSARLEEAALTVLGALYVPLPLVLALLLPCEQLLLLLAVAAGTDTCAYFAGNLWGKRRIWPKVSPRKSVEGCLGGIAGSVLACLGFGLYYDLAAGTGVCLGIFLAVFAMLGDFFESALKRAHDAKDSGVLLPGHGGMLDRLDSFLFVTPAYTVLNLLVRAV